MTRTVQDVKFALHTIMDKLVGNHSEPFNTEEIEVLIFAFESHILFDNVAHKFLSSLKGIVEISDLNSNKNNEEHQSPESRDFLFLQERSTMVKTLLLTVIKESILREMSIRFGS
ncbi:hypothetical protein SAMN04487896_4877 [Paenibacillus sp. ov031]|uniref:Uncharacterized protein n=2 Tax=Paenibacillus TaxID=44249 RepID=A0ABX2MSC4_9BACL|nr:hypothetical protein [Paenibacillus sp. ov031]NUU56996.1 hypothetical protein [Paenibacillus taichungensis]SLJ91509.1 hypothetical protein SAMN06272722_101837 [Paenibacillus sp. RU5A]SOC58811.1 hypothetical protein SAMN05880581_101354 [Paenibacillus sp. RU26A]SOC67862.1 hypothetical protein SAMN05880586_101353 [Paenibacillus sp. RU5M]SHN81875.1 hypothetical protein SAMN04487896_4877 [Paenibacillus sp. ov031]